MQPMRINANPSRPAVSSRCLQPKVALPKLVARAESEKSAAAKLSDSMGMPTNGGIFGFTPFAEQWVGRWAMFGFAASVIGEFNTGYGALGQLGLETPSTPLFFGLLALSISGIVAGTVLTGKKAMENKMGKGEISRYKNFLGLNQTEEADIVAKQMKRKGDFTTPGDDERQIAAAKAQGAPVDKFLATNEMEVAEQVSREMKEGESSSAPAPVTPAQRDFYPSEASDIAFAKDIELSNGRLAMIGFLASILVEAATGEGILGQVIFYLKEAGVLGDKSGF